MVALETLPQHQGLVLHSKQSADLAEESSIQLMVAPASHATLSIAWTPQHSGTMQVALYFQWGSQLLKVQLFGSAPALPVSSLMHASIKSAVLDASPSHLALTPAGQKLMKAQRAGGISPGHPTFEAALRSIKAAPASKGANSPGLSRYAAESAPSTLQSPAPSTFAARLQAAADSPPKPALLSKPRVRLKSAPGRAPMKSLQLSIGQPTAAPNAAAKVKTASAKAPGAAAKITRPAAGASCATGTAAEAGSALPSEQAKPAGQQRFLHGSNAECKGFAYFHSRYGYLVSLCLKGPVCQIYEQVTAIPVVNSITLSAVPGSLHYDQMCIGLGINIVQVLQKAVIMHARQC